MVAMANTPWANTGVIIYGIDPEKEKQVTEIYKKIVPGGGEYLDKDKTGKYSYQRQNSRDIETKTIHYYRGNN